MYIERNHLITLDRYTRSVVVYKERGFKDAERPPPRRSNSEKRHKLKLGDPNGSEIICCGEKWFLKRTPGSLNNIQKKILKLFEHGQNNSWFGSENSALLWVTLTTQQHRTKATDKLLYYNFKKLFQHESFGYISVCERQRETGDLHFHIITTGTTFIDAKGLLNRWAGILGVEEHPALVAIKPIKDLRGVGFYISKYVRKSCPGWKKINEWYKKYGSDFKPPYSSLFWCRTFSTGRIDFKAMDSRLLENRITIPSRYHKFLGEIKLKKDLGNVELAEYSDELYLKAKKLNYFLKKGGLID